MSETASKSMDEIMALCKRRGFIYQASEIYGGINGFWDYGPLGAQLKKNLRDAWWQDMVMNPCRGKPGPNGEPVRIVPVDTCIIQNPKVWEASGHVEGFNDPMVQDKETKQRFRADHLQGIFLLGETEPASARAVREHARQWREQAVDPTRMPIATIAAANPAEALDLLTNKSVQRTIGVTYVATHLRDGSSPPFEGIPVEIRYQGREQTATIRQVPMEMLEQQHERVPSPYTGKSGSLMAPRAFNLMFRTYIGATATEDDVAYLRPETAQGIFLNFKNVVDTTRVGVPFGIAQIGKAFRNEVTPRNFTFRSREFEQMEMEFFCHPDDARDWYAFWRDTRMAWWESLGLAGDNLILREHDADELAHYAHGGAGTSDVEYRFPFTHPGFGELEGVAHRTDFDLRQHQEHSGVKLDYFDPSRGEIGPNGQPKGERYLPHVIEPAAGLDRGVLAVLCEAFTPTPDRRGSKYVMRFHPRLAPIKAAVYPLVNKDGMPEVARKLHEELVARFGHTGAIEFDAKQAIGKRYARMDEAGCPFCFTIDGDTLQDQTVTVRERDSAAQERIGLDAVSGYLAERVGL